MWKCFPFILEGRIKALVIFNPQKHVFTLQFVD